MSSIYFPSPPTPSSQTYFPSLPFFHSPYSYKYSHGSYENFVSGGRGSWFFNSKVRKIIQNSGNPFYFFGRLKFFRPPFLPILAKCFQVPINFLIFFSLYLLPNFLQRHLRKNFNLYFGSFILPAPFLGHWHGT